MKISDMITQLAIVLGTFFGAYIVFSLLYELGKYIFGKANGFKFVSFRLSSSIRAKGKENATKGYYQKSNFKTLDLVMYKDKEFSKTSAVMYNIGGSIFNGIIVIALLVTALVMQDGDNIRAVLFISAITGLFVISQNLIPYNNSTSSDGSYLKVISSSDESLRLYYTNLEYMHHICENKPSTFDYTRFIINEEFDPVNPTHATAFVNLVKYYTFKHDFRKANELLEEKSAFITLFVDEIMHDLKLKSIFFKTMIQDEQAIYEQDNLTGETKDVSKGKTIDRAIENYAFNKFVSMDEYASEEAYDQAIKLFDKSPYDGLIEEQKELLDYLKEYRFIKIDKY